MSYHPNASRLEPLSTIPSGTPDRFPATRLAGEIATSMRDGCVLRGDLYMPVGCDRAPVVLVRQPYGRATPEMKFAALGRYWASKGYACVIQDVRGKFSSEGEFDPMVREAEDGFDTVEWIGSQPWCNGRVGMFGESYYGFTSLAAAVEQPSALACIAPGDIASDRHRIWFPQGAFLLNTVGAWAIAMDAPEYADLSRYSSWHTPLVDLAKPIGHGGHYFRTMVEHAYDRAWWAKRSVRDRLDKITVPVLLWSGWYDNYTAGLLEDYAALKQTSPRPETIHLLVGPWDHEASTMRIEQAICVPLPETNTHRWDAYQAFFDCYLRGEDDIRCPSVNYFTIGRNTWSHSPAWPLARMRATPFYLRTGNTLTVDAPIGPEEADRFVYDPNDPVTQTVGRNCWALCSELEDRRSLDARPDVVTYTTAPLTDDVELTGPIQAVLYAASSAIDTDFTVALSDVFEDGTANQIQDGIIRAVYRNDAYRPDYLVPEEVYALTIDMAATSYLVRAGHRLRVSVSSSCFDRYDRNPNTGEPFGQAVTFKIAQQAIHHSKTYPSHILLPIVPGG